MPMLIAWMWLISYVFKVSKRVWYIHQVGGRLTLSSLLSRGIRMGKSKDLFWAFVIIWDAVKHWSGNFKEATRCVHLKFTGEAQIGYEKGGPLTRTLVSVLELENKVYTGSVGTLEGVLQLAREGKVNEEDKKRRGQWGWDGRQTEIEAERGEYLTFHVTKYLNLRFKACTVLYWMDVPQIMEVPFTALTYMHTHGLEDVLTVYNCFALGNKDEIKFWQ